MQLRTFTIPLHDPGDAAEEVNAFMRQHRILTTDRHFASEGAKTLWAICVTFLEATHGR